MAKHSSDFSESVQTINSMTGQSLEVLESNPPYPAAGSKGWCLGRENAAPIP